MDPDPAGEVRIRAEAQPPAQASEPSAAGEGPKKSVRGIEKESERGQDPVEEHPRAIIAYNSRVYDGQKTSNGRGTGSV